MELVGGWGVKHRKCGKTQQDCMIRGPAVLSTPSPFLAPQIGNSFSLEGKRVKEKEKETGRWTRGQGKRRGENRQKERKKEIKGKKMESGNEI